MVFPQFNLPWQGPPVEPNRRQRIIWLKEAVDIIAAEVERMIDRADQADRTVFRAGFDCLEAAHTALVGASEELDDAEFQFTRPGARSLGEAIEEVLGEGEKEQE